MTFNLLFSSIWECHKWGLIDFLELNLHLWNLLFHQTFLPTKVFLEYSYKAKVNRTNLQLKWRLFQGQIRDCLIFLLLHLEVSERKSILKGVFCLFTLLLSSTNNIFWGWCFLTQIYPCLSLSYSVCILPSLHSSFPCFHWLQSLEVK